MENGVDRRVVDIDVTIIPPWREKEADMKCKHDSLRRYCGKEVYCELCKAEISAELCDHPPHEGPCHDSEKAVEAKIKEIDKNVHGSLDMGCALIKELQELVALAKRGA